VPNDPDPATRYRLRALANRGALLRLALIGLTVLVVRGCFVFVGGWLSSSRLTRAPVVDGFEKVNSVWPGFRRNHSEGICIAGYFDSAGREFFGTPQTTGPV
jgi:catalase